MGGLKNLTGQSLDLPVYNGKFVSNHRMLFVVQKGFVTRLFSISDQGEATPYGLDRQVGAFDVSDKGDLVFESFDATHLPEIWLVGSDKKPVQLSHFNKAFDSLKLVAPTLITYKSFRRDAG